MRPERVVVHGLGDSLTAAIADVWTNDRLTPWHEILADLLCLMGMDVELKSKLARVGASSREVLTEQVLTADIQSGDLVCLWVGGNDVLRSNYAIGDSRAALGRVFDAVHHAGGAPLTMELPRISDVLPGPAWAMRSWDAQGALVNQIVKARSHTAGGVHIRWPGPRVSGPDGTHLSQRGHYFYAEQYAIRLAERWALPVPTVEVPLGMPVFTPRDRRRWYLKHGWLWLVRRRLDNHRAQRRHRTQSGLLGAGRGKNPAPHGEARSG